MNPSLIPDYLNHIWAKKPLPGCDSGEPLAHHTWLLLSRLAEHARQRPYLPDIFGFKAFWSCMFWSCFLHDFGKTCSGFQASLRGGQRWPHRHEVFSLLFLEWSTNDWSDEETLWISAAILSHHREPGYLFELYDVMDKDYTIELIKGVIRDIGRKNVELLWNWLHDFTGVWIKELDFEKNGIRTPIWQERDKAVNDLYSHGAESIYNHFRKYRSLIRSLQKEKAKRKILSLAVRGLMNLTDYSASAGTGEAISNELPSPTQFLDARKLEVDKLYSHQKECMSTKGLTLLVAPTGSGKTESAILWALSQNNNFDRPPKLFYMLPYQTSMNAMYDRFQQYGFKKKVGLEHGRSVLALYKRIIDEQKNTYSAAQEARLSKQLARLNYYSVKILSPYQLLKALFRLKPYELILYDYFNATVILDEIHAYEPSRLALIFGLIYFLQNNFNTHFFITTATLPSLIERKIEECIGMTTKIQADHSLFKKFQRHRICLLDGEVYNDVFIKKITEIARTGKSVLVCVNRVKKAQSVYQLIQNKLANQDSSIKVLLLHGRFNARDRLQIEKEINDMTGVLSITRKPVILVATQVVEVSLDIDLDIIFTEPAPLEALMQRFGRINRRMKQRIADVFIFRQPADGQKIYQDKLVINTLELLERHNQAPLQEDKVSEWLGEIYSAEIQQEWEREFDLTYDNFIHGNLPALYGFNTNIGMEKEFYKAFDSVEVLPASLEKEYIELLKTEPIRASELLVPIRPGQLNYLSTWMTEEKIIVVDADYSELGLLI